MTIDEMRRKKQEYGYSYAKLSELTGVPHSTIQKVFSGETKNPRYDTLRLLTQVFSDRGKPQPDQEMWQSTCMREAVSSYGISAKEKHQGTYTVTDYLDMPDERRAELIDGVLYDMTAPGSFHQLIVGEIYWQVNSYIRSREGSCVPFIAPIDVQLDQDDKTMLQPDMLIVCDPNIITEKNIFGAPDYVLEVVSPGTKKRDYYVKLRKYEQAGVREYWIVDPYQKVIIVHFFESAVGPTIYPLDGDVPVNIYGGELVINIAGLLKRSFPSYLRVKSSP